MLATVLAFARDSEIVVVEYRRSLIGWLLIGLIAGWLAGKIARGRGYGCITDIILGLIGSLLGGWIFTKLGIVNANSSFLYSLAAATVGAIILVSIVHIFVGGDKS